jgi:hypothetical protein
LPGLLGKLCAFHPQIQIGLAQVEFPEKYIAQVFLIVLPGVNKDMLTEPIQVFDNDAQPNDLGPGPEKGQYFHA